jgi:hypothetical protein
MIRAVGWFRAGVPRLVTGGSDPAYGESMVLPDRVFRILSAISRDRGLAKHA